MADIIDIAIVGAGPAGLTAAIYGARGRAKTVVFETGLPGGQIVSASWVENYPGFPDGITGQDLGDLMHRQALNAGAEFRTISPVEVHPHQRMRLRPHLGRPGTRRARRSSWPRVPSPRSWGARRIRVHRPGHLVVRHLRRSPVPRQGGPGGRWGRFRHAGSPLPVQDRRKRYISCTAETSCGPPNASRSSAS